MGTTKKILVLIIAICIYIILLYELLRFTMKNSVKENDSNQLKLRAKPFPVLRQTIFSNLNKQQLDSLNTMTSEWCSLFECNERISKDDITAYEEFCKEILMKNIISP